MTKSKIQSDLGYVRELVRASDKDPTSRAIYLLWAAIVLVGFSMVDFAPRYVGFFWMAAGPLGGIFSGILGCRHSRERGQVRSDVGMRHMLHWSGMLVLVGLATLLAVKGHLDSPTLSKVILLIVTYGWWTAGVHFDRNFLFLGGVMAAGFVMILFYPHYAWTALGAVIAIVLSIIAFRKGASDVTQEA